MRWIKWVLLAIAVFFVGWPLWSGYRIYSALENQNAELLSSKIDFDRVRTTLKPSVGGEVEKQMDKALGEAGLPSALVGDVKKQMLPKIVDGAMGALVTPANVLRIYREGEDVASTVRKILAEQMSKGGVPGLPNLGSLLGGATSGGAASGVGAVLGGLGGLGGLGIPGLGGRPAADRPVEAPKPEVAAATGTKPKYGFGNIKGFGLDGLLGLRLSLAKDPAAKQPDLTAGMSFTGFDWKLTKVELHR